MSYVERGMRAGRNTFMVYGKYDPTMLPEPTRQMLDSLRRHGADPRTLELLCGHYSLELAPFSYIARYSMLTFFLESVDSWHTLQSVLYYSDRIPRALR